MVLLALNSAGSRIYAFQVDNSVANDIVLDSVYRLIVQTDGSVTIYYYDYSNVSHSVNVAYTLSQFSYTSSANQWYDVGSLTSNLGLYDVQWLDDAHFEIYSAMQVRNLFVRHTSGAMRFESVLHQTVTVETQTVMVEQSTLPTNLETTINKLGNLTWVFYGTLALCCLIFLFRKRGV